ncbi:hypothetical protein J4464_02090 [Candidatus Woesearchaeota archaeon]|nr:hypothetical protein [Candidatus Woesearchaeota archaeon]
MRGRPPRSKIREHIAEILAVIGRGYGYQIYQYYSGVFPKVTQRVIYYHLKKGVQLQEFVVQEIRKEQGKFSWGSEVEKTYYALGPNAKPLMKDDIREKIKAVR